MTSHPPADASKDYGVKPSRLNLRETQAERLNRVRKHAEHEFKSHQEQIRKANKDKHMAFGIGGVFNDPIFEEMEREMNSSSSGTGRNGRNGFGFDHLEANLARPTSISSGPDVRIPSRYQTTTTTTTTSTSTHTSTTTSTSTYSLRTDNRGHASVHVSDISDAQLHAKMTKKMEEKEKRAREREAHYQRQRKRDLEEARYKEARLAEEIKEKEREEEAREQKKRKEREWESHNGTAYEEAQEAFRKKRRGSTPLYGTGMSTDEDDNGQLPKSSTGWSDPPERGQGNGYGYVHSGSRSTRRDIPPTREREMKERERYLSRWKSLLSTTANTNTSGSGEESDGIIETELSYTDIPWPIYTYSNESKMKLDKKNIQIFLSNLATIQVKGKDQGIILSGKEAKDSERKILREAIRNFHPDRFLSKVLPRVREGERERVREGMEICSRVLTDLITENASSR